MDSRPRTGGAAAGTLMPVVGVLCALVLTGCGGGDDGAPAEAASDGPPGEQVTDCRADVSVSGDEEASWKGRAKVNLRNESDEGAGPAARYTSADGKSRLSLFSVGPDFTPTVTLSVGDRTFSGGEDPQGLDAAEDGTTATADLELTGPEDATVSLQATFDCPQEDDES